MSKTKIAKRYATAVFDLAVDNDHLEPVRADLQAIYRLVNESAEFSQFLEDPLLPPARRSKVLHALLKDQVEPLVFKTLLFLEDKQRINLLKEVCAEFEKLYNARMGILKVRVISARKLESTQESAIATRLKEKFNKEIITSVRIDPSLLGGFKLIIGDQVLDFSLETQLHRLRQNILNA